MSIDTGLAADLQKLLSLEPALMQELKQAGNGEQAIECVIATAGRHGITLDAEELTVFLQTSLTDAAQREINDEQLVGVVGGIDLLGVLRGLFKGIRHQENKH